MPILSINTAYGNTDIALIENHNTLAAYCDKEPGKQAETLFLHIGELLKEANKNYTDLTAIAANIGPGSFTGIRIGLAAARGVALAADIPVIGVDGLAAINYAANKEHKLNNLLVVLDAKRGQIFAQFFGQSKTLPLLLDYNEITKAFPLQDNINITGNAIELIAPYLNEAKITYKIINGPALPDAVTIGNLADIYLKDGNYSKASPLYIRQPDAKVAKNA